MRAGGRVRAWVWHWGLRWLVIWFCSDWKTSTKNCNLLLLPKFFQNVVAVDGWRTQAKAGMNRLFFLFISIFSLHKTIWQFIVLLEFLPNFLVFIKWRAQVKGGWLDRNMSPLELLTATKLQSWRPLASHWALELSRHWSQGTDSPCSSWCQSKASSSRNCTPCHEPDEEQSQNDHPSCSYSATVDRFTRQTLNCFEHLLLNL